MARRTPLRAQHVEGEGVLSAYGPAEAGIELVEAFDPVEVEYAAIRTHAAVFDQPHRGMIAVRGDDRLGFLNRMITQELKGLAAGEARRGFWLNRKGRIEADLRVVMTGAGSADGSELLLELDAHNVEGTIATLSGFVIAEDVAFEDVTESLHALGVHGPETLGLLRRLAGTDGCGNEWVERLQAPGTAGIGVLAGVEVTCVGTDLCGEAGVDMLVPVDRARQVYEALSTPWSARGTGKGAPAARSTDLARRVGWHAVNIARIEAGSALYNLDFGPSSLPHEAGAGVLRSRVSFTKGCYLGQEVVARMHSLGHPKQVLVGLLMDEGGGESQPVTGTRVLDGEEVVGAVTSSAFSPMLGQRAVCFAMLKHGHAVEGRTVRVLSESGLEHGAVVRMDLAFWRRGEERTAGSR